MTTGRPLSPSYLDYTGRDDILSGGVRMIPVDTPKGTFRVWTKRVGNAPTMRLLLLHGGPGATHEYFEAFDSYLPAAGIEYYYYDQLGSFYSDQPDEPDLWELPRFVDEVEQVRQALGLDRDNFFLLGHSWGGILAIEYALRYQQHLKGLIISNMMASCPAYNAYAHDVLMPAMDQAVLAEIKGYEAAGDFENPRYMELLVEQHYVHHVLRMPAAEWPDPVNRAFKHHQPVDLRPAAGAERAGSERQAGRLGPHRRPRPDRGADAGHRRAARHDGPGPHGVDGRRGAARALSALSRRQPHGDVRRPAGLRPWPDRLHPRRGCGPVRGDALRTVMR